MQDLYEKYGKQGFVGFNQQYELTPLLEEMFAEADPNYATKPAIKIYRSTIDNIKTLAKFLLEFGRSFLLFYGTL